MNSNDTEPRTKTLNATKICSLALSQSKQTEQCPARACLARGVSRPRHQRSPLLRPVPTCLPRWTGPFIKGGVSSSHRPGISAHTGQTRHLSSSRMLYPGRLNNWDGDQWRSTLGKCGKNCSEKLSCSENMRDALSMTLLTVLSGAESNESCFSSRDIGIMGSWLTSLNSILLFSYPLYWNNFVGAHE